MAEKLECLASPTVFVGGQAFLRGLQNKQTPQMAGLLLHMLSTLPNEIGQKLSKIRGLVAEVKDNFGVVVPAYHWDKDTKTFERVLNNLYLAVGKDMSQVPQYLLSVNSEQLIMGQLPQIQDWTGVGPDGLSHNSPGPDLNLSEE
jgi:hypothetical protein